MSPGPCRRQAVVRVSPGTCVIPLGVWSEHVSALWSVLCCRRAYLNVSMWTSGLVGSRPVCFFVHVWVPACL